MLPTIDAVVRMALNDAEEVSYAVTTELLHSLSSHGGAITTSIKTSIFSSKNVHAEVRTENIMLMPKRFLRLSIGDRRIAIHAGSPPAAKLDLSLTRLSGGEGWRSSGRREKKRERREQHSTPSLDFDRSKGPIFLFNN